MDLLFPSKTKCRRYQNDDGSTSMQKSSGLCMFYIGLMVLSVAAQLANAVRRVDVAKNVAGAAATALLIVVMYRHCAACDGLSGFFKVVLANLAVQMLLNAAFPSDDDALVVVAGEKGAAPAP